MGFFANFYHSLFDVTWLAAVRSEHGRAWKFFFGFSAITSLIFTGVSTAIILPTLRSVEKEVVATLPDFKAEIASGTLKVTGIIQPFIQRDPEGPFLFVLDTVSSSTPTIDSLVKKPEGEIVVINRSGVEMFSESQSERKTYSFSTFKPGSVSRDDVKKFADRVTSVAGSVLIASALFFIFFFGLIIGHVLSLLLVDGIAFIIASFLERPWRYGELFTVGLFAPALPLLVTCVITILGFNIPYLYSLSLLAYLLAVVVTVKPVTPSAESSAETPHPTV
jgi:hypothetical protein